MKRLLYSICIGIVGVAFTALGQPDRTEGLHAISDQPKRQTFHDSFATILSLKPKNLIEKSY